MAQSRARYPDNLLQKIRNLVKLASHEQCCPSACPDRSLPSGGSHAADKGARNICPAKNPRNPLISLDSDERIQGNPRKSNPQNRGLRSETATRQENPNGSTGPMSWARCREGARTHLHPKAERLKRSRRLPRGKIGSGGRCGPLTPQPTSTGSLRCPSAFSFAIAAAWSRARNV
jgi:hypothetical protein